MHHHICLKVTIPTGCFQSMTEHEERYKCSPIPMKHKTPSVGDLTPELPVGLAEPLLEVRCSQTLTVPPAVPLCFLLRPFFPSEGSFCMFPLCPPLSFTALTLSCMSNPTWHASWRTQTHNDHDF